MKRYLILVALSCIVAMLSAGVSYHYSLQQPKLNVKGEFTEVEVADAQSWGNPGDPNLPWYGIKLLLPVGTEGNTINITRTAPVYYSLTAPIAPLQRQYPFSHEVLEPPTSPNSEIYGSGEAFPYQTDNGLMTYFLSGHPIAFSAFSPFEYHPLKNELVFYQKISVDIDYTSSDRAIAASALLKTDEFIATRLRQSIDNPEAISGGYRSRETGIEYLIVIDAAKLSNWLPLKSLYESRGMSVAVRSMTEIVAESQGADTQEKLRNYLIQIYSTNPLRYVLLAGDTDVIPHRGFYVNMGQGAEYTDADIPADMYYSCLDGNWNTDGDSYWGEMYEADLTPEFAIGRYCYSNDTEISNFINKVMSYLITPVEAELKSALFAGEWLWDGPTWGGDYMDEMIGGSSMHGYTTVGVPTTWNITTLYDRTYGAADSWGANQIRPLLNQGPNFVNHLGHSNTTYTMRLSNNQTSATTITNNGANHNFSIYFTQGCYSGAFDNRTTSVGDYTSDCIAEKMTTIATAAVGMISHSRYGWGMQGSTDGASQYIHRQYNDAIFGENILELGYTLVDSKIDNIPYITNTPVMYWVCYETNLLGDPAMMLWTDTPQQITASLPTQWMVGVNSYQIPTNAPNAVLTITSGTDRIYRCIADASGLLNVQLMQSLVPGNYQIYITAPNFYTYESTIQVTAAQMPYIICNNIQYQDADGLYHTGEVITVSLSAQNVGMLDLTVPGNLVLSSPSANINVLSGTIPFTALATGDSLVLNNAFTFGIVGNYEDNTRADLVFTAIYDGFSAATTSFLNLNAPELALSSYQVNNPDFVIMPGDTPTISFTVHNSGSGNAYSPMMILFTTSDDVTLSSYELTFPPVGFNSTITYEDAFTVMVSESAEIGSSVQINYIFGAENGNTVEGSFTVYVGMSSYGFEPDLQGWEVMNLNTSFTNQWHRSSTRNNTPNGSYSMKFGSQTTGNYAGSAYGAVVSPVMNVSPNCQLEFYHWMDAETHSNPIYAWDGGMVQMSLNGGAWTQIIPVGNYPFRIYNNPASPFPANTYVYSGSFSWQQAIFLLENVSGTAQFRWVFGSDGNVAGEGWYIDDIKLTGVVSNSDNTSPEPDQLKLYTNYPNPFNPHTTLSFSLPLQGNARLDIFNVKGQLVTSLVNGVLPAGNHKILWDGTDSSLRPVSTGLYYYRLTTQQGTLTKKMMLLK